MLQIVIESNYWRRPRTTWETRRHTGVARLNFLFYWFSVTDLGCLIIFNFSLNMLLSLVQWKFGQRWVHTLIGDLFSSSAACNTWYYLHVQMLRFYFIMCACRTCLCMCVQACMCVWERERNMIIAHCFVSCFGGVHVTYACTCQVSNWHGLLTWWSYKRHWVM